MIVIDSHQHFWRLADPWTDWPTATEAAIHRDFGPADLAPHLQSCGVERTILVQAAPDVRDTERLLQIAGETPWVAGVVGWIDFADPPAAVHDIARFVGGGALLGVRPMLQSIPDADWILDPAFSPVFDALCAANLAFDALVRPRHLRAIAELARRRPDLRIVIDHAGKPDIANGDLHAWSADLRELARMPSVACKLSGLVTEAKLGASVDAFAPYVDVILSAFGPARVLWGSDWPVVNLASSYQDWFDMARRLTAGLSDAEQAEIFGGAARSFYRL